MSQAPAPQPDENGLFPETAPLRRLRVLVTVLMVVLIGGVLTVSVLLVISLAGLGADGSAVEGIATGLPDSVAVPANARVTAVGRGGDGEILMVIEGPGAARTLRSYDAATGALLDSTEIAPE